VITGHSLIRIARSVQPAASAKNVMKLQGWIFSEKISRRGITPKGDGMINGWEDFFNAVELMRQYQKEYSRTQNHFVHNQCAHKEAEVDACIERRWQKAAEAGQKNLPLGG
jgi:hypothetical protein